MRGEHGGLLVSGGPSQGIVADGRNGLPMLRLPDRELWHGLTESGPSGSQEGSYQFGLRVGTLRRTKEPGSGGRTTARTRFIVAGILVVLLVAPFVWLIGFGYFLEERDVGLAILPFAWVALLAGLGIVIYGLVARRRSPG